LTKYGKEKRGEGKMELSMRVRSRVEKWLSVEMEGEREISDENT
jgi:hypothetical protein